jgi:hypothetical protein
MAMFNSYLTNYQGVIIKYGELGNPLVKLEVYSWEDHRKIREIPFFNAGFERNINYINLGKL